MRTAIDNLYLYDPQFEAGAKKFIAEMGGSSAMRPIRSASDIANCLKEFVLVKFLVFDTHGSPGKIWLANGRAFEGIDFITMSQNTQFLAKDARVLFLGCNLAEGSPGDTFLSDIGKFLLRGKGGTVGATTVPNVTFQIGSYSSEAFMMPLSFGRLKVKRYAATGDEVGSMTTDRHGWSR